ncbi:MAG: hypothetical protein J0M20_15050 [Burkholderiales bacterium]|nr:hypothetical protein [Burkholderiales bacterium]
MSGLLPSRDDPLATLACFPMTSVEADAADRPLPARVALHIERLQGPWMTGWMLDRTCPGQEALRLCSGDRCWPLVELRRLPRAGVCQALGLAPALQPGFEAELPAEAWQALLEGLLEMDSLEDLLLMRMRPSDLFCSWRAVEAYHALLHQPGLAVSVPE